MERVVLWTLVVSVAAGAKSFECPPDETTGKFADSEFCDQYWDCFRGEAKKVQCSDGLGFDPERVEGLDEPCDYLFKVNCTGREALGPAQATENCPRANGIFPHENDCGKYYNCKGGVATSQLCPPGLHFSLEKVTCDWPDVANRTSCTLLRSLGNFTCDPSEEYFTPQNQKIVHPTFAHDNCRKFYVCKNGIDPAISSCDYGLVYSIDKATCDEPINVPDCETYYDALEAETAGDALSSQGAF